MRQNMLRLYKRKLRVKNVVLKYLMHHQNHNWDRVKRPLTVAELRVLLYDQVVDEVSNRYVHLQSASVDTASPNEDI